MRRQLMTAMPTIVPATASAIECIPVVRKLVGGAAEVDGVEGEKPWKKDDEINRETIAEIRRGIAAIGQMQQRRLRGCAEAVERGGALMAGDEGDAREREKRRREKNPGAAAQRDC